MHRKLSLPAPSSRDPDLKYLKYLKPGDSVPDVKYKTWSSTLDLIAEDPVPEDMEPDETEAPSIAIYVDCVTDVDSSDPIQQDLDSDVLDELQVQDAVQDSEVKSELCLTDPVQYVLNKGVMSDFNTSDSGFHSSTGQLPSVPQTNPRLLLKTKLSLDLTDSESSAISIEQTSLPTFSVNRLPLPPRRNNSAADIPPRPDAPKPVKLTQSLDSKLSQLRALSNQARGLDLSDAKMKLIQVYIDEEDEDKPSNDYMLFDPETDWPPKQVRPTTSGTQSSMGTHTDDNDFLYSSSTGSSTETSAMTVIERFPHMQVGQRISTKSVDSADTLYSHTTESVTSSTVNSFKKHARTKDSTDENPKVDKDTMNKMSKDETPKMSRTLASEITDFFKASASKLKPPCLAVHTRRDSKRPIQRDISEPTLKTTQKLIPRSPYIAPPYEGKKPPPPRPLFYAWNMNSKNSAVRYITASASCSNINRDVNQKTMKNIENATRKALIQANGSKKTKDSNEDRLSKSPRPPLDFQAKPRLKKEGLEKKVSAANKHKPSPVRSFAQNLKELKIASKNIPKIHITLPTPRITLTKVKTQLPCEYPRDKAKVKPESPQDKVKHRMEKRNEHPESKMRKWASLSKFLDLVKQNNEDLRSKDPVSYKYKRFNTWPQKKRNTDL